MPSAVSDTRAGPGPFLHCSETSSALSLASIRTVPVPALSKCRHVVVPVEFTEQLGRGGCVHRGVSVSGF